jgi:hypothetical protein
MCVYVYVYGGGEEECFSRRRRRGGEQPIENAKNKLIDECAS